MLTAPQPSYIFWGPELAILYNDLGLPFVGTKHPACLGHNIRDVLKEAWPVLGPLVEGVVATGERAERRRTARGRPRLEIRPPLPGGMPGDVAQRALLLPFAGESELAGYVLIAGLNPRYLFDADARSFLQLLARQI